MTGNEMRRLMDRMGGTTNGVELEGDRDRSRVTSKAQVTSGRL